MKATKYLYFSLFFFLFACTKKESISETLVGKWNVERFTVYTEFLASTPTNVKEQYEDLGKMVFKNDGTGLYTYNTSSIKFTYTLYEDYCEFAFDEDDIQDLGSPIISYSIYGSNPVSGYNIFLGSKHTANFYYQPYGYSNMDTYRKLEFLLTKIE